jgi:two-component system, OmpR family, sensor kinase
MSLKARLILAAAYVLTVVAIGLEVPLALTVSKRENRVEESRVLNFAALLAARINDDLPGASVDSSAGSPARKAIADLVRITAARTGVWYVVVDSEGRLVADSDRDAPVGTLYATGNRPEFARVFSKPGGEIDSDSRFDPTVNQDVLLVTVPVVHFREAIGAVRASEPLGALQSHVHRIWLGYGLVGLVAIAVGMTAAWVLAETLVRPVRRLEDAARQLGSGNLNARAEPGGPAEFVTLAGSFNRMASALSTNISAQKEFLANASHQLRTPLTGLRLRLEAIREEGGFAASQAEKAEAEVDRLTTLVADLLELARVSSAENTASEVDLAESAREAVDRWAPTAESKGKRVSLGSAEPASVLADPVDVSHILDNLIENAVRYAPTGTEVTVAAGRRNGRSLLEVGDTGRGIPAEDQPRIFERFYRGTTGLKAGPGTGLGLAIVDELVRRWGGEIRLLDGPGTRFEAAFPPVGQGTGPAKPAVS